MKKQFLKSVLIGVASVGLFVGSAMAYSFEDMIDTWSVPILGEVGARPIVEGAPFSYSHDINDSVNFSAGHYVTEAFLELDFTNDLTDDYGSTLFGLVKWDYREFTKIAFDGSSWINIGEVDDGQYDMVLDIDWLNDDGILDVTISVSNPTGGLLGVATAYLDHSRLYGTAAVPEPTTMLLFGTGLAGLAAVGRRHAKK